MSTRPIRRRAGRRTVLALGCVLVAAAGTACRQDMHNQPKYEPIEHSAFFPDGRTSRPYVEGVVARGTPVQSVVETGREGGEPVRRMPVPLTLELVERGRTRFDVFCAPCHDRTGSGNGMIVQRGFRRAASLHDPRLVAEADGYVFDVVTNGFGVMPSYGQQIGIDDRWAIVAYVRALQLSQQATLADVPPGERANLEAEAR